GPALRPEELRPTIRREGAGIGEALTEPDPRDHQAQIIVVGEVVPVDRGRRLWVARLELDASPALGAHDRRPDAEAVALWLGEAVIDEVGRGEVKLQLGRRRRSIDADEAASL